MTTALVRCLLGALFIYMGLNKTLHPVEFLKLVRQYDVLHAPFALNLVASALPWFEVFCGMLLVLGVAVRGTAVMLVAMLVPFTVLVFLRALAIQKTGGLPFCAIKFDCGCGAGEVLICRKLAENILLTAISIGLVFWRKTSLCLRHGLL
ncbi:MAG TPA: MauE/DoxX family redox-associated membrane protein [Verrucomicrobiae bacterium]